ncbi:phosphatidate cytidylyltransferase [Phycicoccus sp. HDW14]|uniref:phosphatidate cytidylyltransferase n=1 Tax=Phycicoccus sp. HDW14 TaxID=2714941 RepID=UPI0035302D2D
MPDAPTTPDPAAEDPRPEAGGVTTEDPATTADPAGEDAAAEPEGDAARRTPRAGRDLRAAIGVGLLLGAVVIASLVIDARAFLVVVIAAMVLGAWEVRRAVATRGIRVPLVPLVLGAVGMIAAAYLRGAEALVVTFGLTVVGLLVWRVADGLVGPRATWPPPRSSCSTRCSSGGSPR